MMTRVVDHHGVLHLTPGNSYGPVGETICWTHGAPLGCTPQDSPGPGAYGDQPDPPHEKLCPVCYPEKK